MQLDVTHSLDYLYDYFYRMAESINTIINAPEVSD